MRELNLLELETISGAGFSPPLVAAAGGAAIGVIGYLGAQAGSSQSLSLNGAAAAAASGAVAGAFVPLRVGQAVGGAIASMYGGLAGGYVSRDWGGDSGR